MRATGISGWAIRLGRSVGGRPKNGGCGSLFRSTLSALRGEGDEGCDGGERELGWRGYWIMLWRRLRGCAALRSRRMALVGVDLPGDMNYCVCLCVHRMVICNFVVRSGEREIC